MTAAAETKNVVSMPTKPNGNQPWQCMVCGATMEYAQPISLSVMCEKLGAFINEHAHVPLPDYAPRTLVTLTSRRFNNEPRTVEIMRLVPGTACYLVDLMNGSSRRSEWTAFATASELSDYDQKLVDAEHRAAQEEWDERNPR